MSQINSLQDEAYQYLKKQISDGKLESGKIYSLNAIASMLNISKTPVRDALKRLSQDELVEILPSRGFRLTSISSREIIEIYQLRCAIEGFCCYELASQVRSCPTHPSLDALRKNLEQQASVLTNKGSAKDFLNLDHAFHTIIIEAVNNQRFNQIFNNNRDKISEFILRSLNTEDTFEVTLKNHRRIFDSIASGDAVSSQEAMWEHLLTSRDGNFAAASFPSDY